MAKQRLQSKLKQGFESVPASKKYVAAFSDSVWLISLLIVDRSQMERDVWKSTVWSDFSSFIWQRMTFRE